MTSAPTFDLNQTFYLGLKVKLTVISKHDFLHLTVILTYNSILAKVRVDPHAKYQGQMSNSSAVRVHIDGQTNAALLKHAVLVHASKKGYKVWLHQEGHFAKGLNACSGSYKGFLDFWCYWMLNS